MRKTDDEEPGGRRPSATFRIPLKVGKPPIAGISVQCETGRMVLHDAEAEESFTAPFDCRFPYDDPSASKLTVHGWQISLNAAFCVLHELCRPPKGSDIERDRLRELVRKWTAGPDHPIKAPMLHAARALIEGTTLPWREGVELMKRVADYDGQRAALSIVYFASDCETVPKATLR